MPLTLLLFNLLSILLSVKLENLMSGTVLVSACLLGLETRYDGSHNLSDSILEYLRAEGLTAVPVCPEQLAGLPTPRPKTWFTDGDGEAILDGHGGMIDEDGKDMGPIFSRGAEMSLQIARLNQCTTAILKQRSPSCGCRTIYRSAEKVPGMGVTAALLKRHDIKLLSEEDFQSE